MLTVSLLRKKAIRIPNPTAASAAASVITKIAKTWPCSPQSREKATRFEIDGVENQFNGHQHNHDVAAGEYADHAQNKERRCYERDNVMFRTGAIVVALSY